ncbi:sulfotransferase domain-containing protein [Gloeocapsa sp. BRSZ]
MYLRQVIKTIVPEPVRKKLRANYDKNKKYSNEIQLLKGKKISQNPDKSVVFFTTRKCASTYMDKCIEYLNEKYLNLTQVDLESYIWQYSNQDMYQLLEENLAAFQPQGILYAPLRKYIPIKNLEKYRILLMLRDPRDVIVSNYYSLGFSHSLPLDEERRKEFLEFRGRIQKQTVDEYVVERADRFQRMYSEYCDLIKAQNIQWLRYEDFMQDFELWVNQLGKCLQIEIDEQDKKTLFEMKGGGKQVEENKLKHIRKATPGDHKEKLTQETQDFLNTKFQDILLTLNYK